MPIPAFISALKSDRCVHYINNFLLYRAQSIDIKANVPSEIVEELGNSNHTGIVTAPAEIALTVTVFDTGIELSKNLTGKTTETNFTLSDFANAQVDYIGMVRDHMGNFFRSVYIRNACINAIRYSYDIAGNAVESYELLGDNLTVFDGYILTKTYTVSAEDAGKGYFTLPANSGETPIQTKQNSYFANSHLLRVTKKAGTLTTHLTEGAEYTYDPVTKRIIASGLEAGQSFTIVFCSAQTDNTALQPVYNTLLPPAIRGELTPVSIGIHSKTLIPRLQSAKITINLAQKRISQLGSSQVFFVPGGAPNITGNLSVLMSDLVLRKLITYGNAGSSETQFGIEQTAAYGAQNSLGLEVAIKSPSDNTILKRITIPDIAVTTGGIPVTVNGTLTESFAWTGKTGTLIIANG